MSNNNILLKLNNIKNKIFRKNIFTKIKITGDGNCLFRAISYYKFGNENHHLSIRNLVYNYINENKESFYEFCYEENGYLILKIEQKNQIINFNLNEYIDNIKQPGFFGGFIEIFTLSKIFNQPIIILTPFYHEKDKYYKFLMIYNTVNLSQNQTRLAKLLSLQKNFNKN